MIEPFAFLPRREIDRAAWDSFVAASNEAWFWHTSDLIEALTTFPDLQDVSFGVVDAQGALAAIVPLHLSSLRIKRLIPYRTLRSEGGPAFRRGISISQHAELLIAIRDHLIRQMESLDAERVEARFSPLSPIMQGAGAPTVNPLVVAGFDDWTSVVWMIDLIPPSDEIRRRYANGTRHELRDARQTQFTLREASGGKDLEIFYTLHFETFARTGLKPDPFAYYQAIFERFVPAGNARIVLLERQGRAVAANITVLYKDSAYYWMNASLSEKSGGENRILFDNQLMAARARGCISYEAGKAYFSDDDAKQRGISYFKGSFGSKLVTRHGGRLISSRRKFQLFWAAQKLLRALRP